MASVTEQKSSQTNLSMSSKHLKLYILKNDLLLVLGLYWKSFHTYKVISAAGGEWSDTSAFVNRYAFHIPNEKFSLVGTGFPQN